MAPQSATLDSTAWLNSYPAALRAEGVHWLTVGVYGVLCAIGAIAPEAGVVLLLVAAGVLEVPQSGRVNPCLPTTHFACVETIP